MDTLPYADVPSQWLNTFMNCLDIICRAFRRIGVIAGGQLPLPSESDDALEILKGIHRRLIADGALGVLTEISVEGEYTACPGQRITAGPNATITLPDSATDMAVICIVDPARNQVDEYIYDGRSKKWDTIDDLDLSAPAILANRDPIGLSCYLALELADEYGQQPTQFTIQNAARWQIGITHNWSAEPVTARGTYY